MVWRTFATGDRVHQRLMPVAAFAALPLQV